MKNIYLVVGASGTGKTTLVEQLEKHYGASAVYSYTDRPQRFEGEGGHTYVTPEEFDKLPPMVAYTEFAGHRYGVTQDMLEKCSFYVIDPDGVMYLYRHYRGDKSIKVIGVTATDNILINRLVARDKNIERFAHDKKIFTESVMCLICDDIIDSSNSVEETFKQAIKVIDKYEE